MHSVHSTHQDSCPQKPCCTLHLVKWQNAACNYAHDDDVQPAFVVHPQPDSSFDYSKLFVQAALQKLPSAIPNANPQAVGLGAASLAVALLTPQRITKIVPSSLLALLLGTAASFALGLSKPISNTLSVCISTLEYLPFGRLH